MILFAFSTRKSVVLWIMAPVIVIFLCGDVCGFNKGNWKEETNWSEDEKSTSTKRGPSFIAGLPNNTSVTVGKLAILQCRVSNLRGRAVSWIRKGDLQVLATNLDIFTSDERFKVVAWREGSVWTWNLEIEESRPEDSGIYECQVNTRPKMSLPVDLRVIQAGAEIAGPSEVYLHAGSRLLLTCWVFAPPKAPGIMTWYHNGTEITSLTPREGLSLFVNVEGPKASSRLSVINVNPRDAGNYTCRPEGLDSDEVSVYVLKDKEPAAMHHENTAFNAVFNFWYLFLTLPLVIPS